jgi:ABC-type antimicrobial peptide transport system permease subunit
MACRVRRVRQLGIRIALGATPLRVVAVAALPGALLAVAGAGIGLIVARTGSTTMRHLVWGVSVADPLTFAVASGSVLLVALVATLVPVVRIVRLNPVKALRAS